MADHSRPGTDTPLFYRGDLDDQVVTANNGAKVNRDYAAFMQNGIWSTEKTWRVHERVHTITGYGLPNYTFVEGDRGLILFDTGINKGMGQALLKKKQEFSSKPIVAIIYSHHHYTGGTGGILSAYPEQQIPIYGHPKLDENLLTSFLVLGPTQMRRGPMQMGAYLPATGPDAFHAIHEPHFDDSALNAHAHHAVTYPVGHGEKVEIDGLEFVFYHAIADTDDSLIVHVPRLNLVMHNAAVMPFLFPLYTLRGDYYRSIPDMIESIDLMRGIRPERLVGCHGAPILDADEAFETLTTHRDAFAYLHQQTVQGINAGKTPDELAASIRLPERWAADPSLFPAYVDVEHIVRGIYRGMIGWWAEDAADLHPPEQAELSAIIVEGFGGPKAVVAKARKAYAQRKYNLTAKLLSLVLAVAPDHAEARQLKADALRRMAQATPTGVQSRSYLLTEALHLEGSINRNLPPVTGQAFPPPSIDAMLSLPIGQFVRLLEYRINAEKAQQLNASVALTFADADQTHGLSVRHGAVEYTDHRPPTVDVKITIDRRHWLAIIFRQTTLASALEQGTATVSGDRDALARFLKAYEGTL